MKKYTKIKKKSKDNGLRREEAIVVNETMSPINECYNSLKDNLLYLSTDSSTKVLQILSSCSGEGKTTLSCNLAVSLSFNKKKVVVIDLDFRKPRVNRLFNMPNGAGLVDYVLDKIEIDGLIRKTSYENVDIITRGSAIYNPSFLLTSERFKDLIAELRNEYDFIILDSPPVLLISDYVHISNVSDGVIFVTRYGRTRKSQIKESSNLLKKNGINVIGAVMTFVDKKDPYSSYYGSYRERYGYDDNTVVKND